MIRELTPDDQRAILDFVYLREQENLFVIGSFDFLPHPFESNVYLGYFQENELIGLGTYFGRWSDIQICTEDLEAHHALVDAFMQRKKPVEYVVGFKRYTLLTIERLLSHGIEPKATYEETVYLLTRATFHNMSTGAATQATPADIDEIVRLARYVEGNETGAAITQKERDRVLPDNEWVLRKEGRIVSKANIHGVSKHFAQIGGVLTHPDYQNQGYAKQTVSTFCQHWLDQDKQPLLFVKNDNQPAIKVYETLGFQPIDEFLLAEYA